MQISANFVPTAVGPSKSPGQEVEAVVGASDVSTDEAPRFRRVEPQMPVV